MKKHNPVPNSSLSSLEVAAPLQFLGYGVQIDEKVKEAWYQQRSRQAQYAFEQGQNCLERGLLQMASFWLGRAERLAGDNGHVIFSYAWAAFELGDWLLAFERFEFLKKKYRLREAVFGSIVCLNRLNRRLEARAFLAEALSEYHLSEEFYPLATELSFLEGHGWVTLSNDGILTVRSDAPFSLSINGKRIGEFATGRYHLAEIEGVGERWLRAAHISVRVDGQHLVGSPLNIPLLTQCDSLVKATEKGIEGWLWYPADPDFIGNVSLNNGKAVILEERGKVMRSDRPLWYPSVFSIAWEELPEQGREVVSIYDHHQRALLGSPVDPRLGRLLSGKPPYPVHLRPVPVVPIQNSSTYSKRSQILRKHKPDCAVIIPVYRGYDVVMACLNSVLETVSLGVEVFVIDDAIEEVPLKEAIEKLASEGRITLLKHAHNRGYPASINHALRYVGQRDVILLNSDTVVFPQWVERLQAWLNHQHIGTVTPFSNDGGLTSYPSTEKKNPFPNLVQARKLDKHCQEFSDDRLINMPTANGFCMAISAECLAETGLLREDIFAQGYGEENDFCLRASVKGFIHVVATNIYVRHVGGASFQTGKEELIKRNLEILNGLHPGYDQLVGEFQRRDPLIWMRRRLDQSLLEKMRVHQKKPRGTILMIQHNAGGGVERVVRERAEHFKKENYLVLSLKPTEQGCRLILCGEEDLFPNLSYSLPSEGAFLVSFLNRLRVKHVEWHHLIGHAPWVRRLHRLLDVPYDVFIHDHVWFCPRIALLTSDSRYCGEPNIDGCQECLTSFTPPAEDIALETLLKRSEEELTAARSVFAPSYDAANRLKRHLSLKREIEIAPLEDDASLLETPLKSRQRRGALRVGVVGGISHWKGYYILKELGSYIQDHNLPIELIVIGGTEDDDALLASGVKVTGEYKDKDVLKLIHSMDLDIGFIPSIAPETWCYSLSWLWKAGLRVLCFDIGAVSERVKKSSRGFVMPLGLPVEHLVSLLLRL